MRFSVGLVICCALAACIGGGQDAETYVPPQPASKTAPSTGISVSGYGRVGVEKGS